MRTLLTVLALICITLRCPADTTGTLRSEPIVFRQQLGPVQTLTSKGNSEVSYPQSLSARNRPNPISSNATSSVLTREESKLHLGRSQTSINAKARNQPDLSGLQSAQITADEERDLRRLWSGTADKAEYWKVYRKIRARIPRIPEPYSTDERPSQVIPQYQGAITAESPELRYSRQTVPNPKQGLTIAETLAEQVHVELDSTTLEQFMIQMPDIQPAITRNGRNRRFTWTFADSSQIIATFRPLGNEGSGLGLVLYMVDMTK